MSFTRAMAAAAAVATTLAVPAGAQAATKSVDAGTPLKSQKLIGNQLGSDVNDYFPHSVTIHVGDRVRWVPTGFHTVDIPPRGGRPLPLVSPTGAKVAGANDAAGNPFWFNGQDVLSFTPAVGRDRWGGKATFNGSRRVESGAPQSQRPQPYTVTFRKTGTFTYFCDIHAGMKGRVRVVPRGRPVPSKKADAAAVKKQVAAAVRIARSRPKVTVPAGVVDVGVAGPGGVEYFGFQPSQVTVPAGTTLRFRMSPGSVDVHTATIGPGDPEKEPTSYLGQLAASFQSPQISPIALYPSDQPPAVPDVTPVSHGNGFWNAGVMDRSAASPPPAENAVRFAVPGTYQMYCLIHPFMHATITVQ